LIFWDFDLLGNHLYWACTCQDFGSSGLCLSRFRGRPITQIYSHCGTKFWMDEKNKKSTQISLTFTVCCANRKVKLAPLLKPPPYLMNMYTSLEPEANSFRRNARSYNSLLACTSFGANVNEEFQKTGVSNFIIYG